ncbi:MAG: hypothetical protein U1E40_10285 [Amaricoccus sp.]
MSSLRTFLAAARESRSLGTMYPGARRSVSPIPCLDFTHCEDPVLQYLRYFADHPGPTNGANFARGLEGYTKEHQ